MTLSVALHHALPGLTLDVAFDAPAGVTSLFGRSGAGKTSVVNAVAGLLRPDRARIVLEGEVLADTGRGIWLPAHKRRIGYVFQEGRLFPHLDVRRNLVYGLRVTGRAVDDKAFARVVEMLGIGALLARRPGALSGGEKQRVAIGRALLAAPRMLLLDEPLAALDEGRKAEILPYLERIRDEAGVPMLHVSHAAAEVARLATTVVVLEAGRVLRAGPTAAVLSDPALTPTGPRAVGALLIARVVAHHDDGLSELDAGGVRLFLPRVASAPGAELRVRIAAHDVILSLGPPEGLSALNSLPGTVAEIHIGDGPGAIVAVETAAGRVLSRVTRRSVARLGLAPGIACHAILKTVSIAAEDVGVQAGPVRAG
ncbi:molybdenum ABC transporter ATP-binding protein [Sinisalibacter aestuarii]|uniref:Molybdenum import ATP-binding protein ModC n=1 Tax=Sinisalibacter aestuarii TaxID=2949426 RepID=A0ABQ5LXI1_9RHOB|nr:molybdenum ABC transporter ATP-binding protein [Sinisalibacter aestuarii]GKY89091.1 molybdenum import ATP-binding protein ModC [Sinisalibacter aestuarii]